MDSIDFNKNVKDLVTATHDHANMSGAELCRQIHEKTLPLLEWLNYLRGCEATPSTTVLLS